MNRLQMTGLLVLAFLVLTAGGVTYSPAPVTESDTPPTLGQVWLKDKSVAVYDADSSVWLATFEDAYVFGRNSTTAANEWMRYGPNGGTSGPGDPSIGVAASGYAVWKPSVITAIDLTVNEQTSAPKACTLMVCQTAPVTGIDTLAFVAFSAPATIAGDHKDLWVPVDSASVISVKLLTGAGTVNNPNCVVRVREKRAP